MRPPRPSATPTPAPCEFLLDARRQLLLPRDEHPPPGRAPGDRAGHRHRPGRRRRSGSPRASRSAREFDDVAAARPRRSRCASTPRTPTSSFAPVAGPDRSCCAGREGPGVRNDGGVYEGVGGLDPLRPDARQADRLGARTARRRCAASGARSTSCASRASAPPCRSSAPCSPTPTSAPAASTSACSTASSRRASLVPPGPPATRDLPLLAAALAHTRARRRAAAAPAGSRARARRWQRGGAARLGDGAVS